MEKEGLFCSGCDSGSNCCDTNGNGAHRCSNGTFGNSIDDGNLVNKSNADKLTYRQLETSAYERKLISKSVYNYTMQQVPALYEGRNVINVSV